MDPLFVLNFSTFLFIFFVKLLLENITQKWIFQFSCSLRFKNET